MSEPQTHAYAYARTRILSPSGRTTVSSVRENRLFNWHVKHMQIYVCNSQSSELCEFLICNQQQQQQQ
jgi:hypothetical protein